MTPRRLRSMYVFGIALNMIAMAYALRDGAYPFAVTFGVIIVYLGIRYRMALE